MTIDDLLQSAFASVEAREFDVAERLCRQILACDPQDYEAMVLLGALAAQTEREPLAFELLRGAIAIEPKSAEAHLQMGALLAQGHRFQEAIESLRTAVRLEPDNPTAHHDLAAIYLRTGQTQRAIECLEQAVELNPTFSLAQFHLGVALDRLGRRQEAINAYRRALLSDPGFGDAQARLAAALLSEGKKAEAMACFQRAVAADPNSELGRLSQAAIWFESDKVDDAERCLREAIANFPQSGFLHRYLGNTLARQGRFSEASTYFERAIATNTHDHGACFDLVASKKITEVDRPLVARMEALLKNAGPDDLNRIYLHFALGKAYDDLADYETAIAHYDEANRQKNRSCSFSAQRFERSVDLIIGAFSAEFLKKARTGGSDSEQPILIVGMPRSGTTLVEQILSSHPEIGGGGELEFWHEGLLELERSGVRGLPMKKLASDYLTLLGSLAPGARRVTDKMPDNFLRIGLIHATFPRARFIHCRRHPVDTALSIYFSNFSQANDYAYDRANIVTFYRQYERLMAHWRSVLPAGRLFEIDYERLIDNREAASRGLVEFCGLDWDDACLKHENNASIVKTASLWQARQPIYRSSLARWRHYEPWLGEFQHLLAGGTD